MIAMKNTLKLIGSFLLISTLFSSCLKDNDYVPIPSGYITFINSFSEAEAISYALNGNRVTSQKYKSYDLPIGAYTGDRNLKVFSHHSISNEYREPLIDTNVTIKDSTGYSAFTFGTLDHPRFALIKDQSIADLKDNSGVRFLNLANEVAKVNLVIGDESAPIFADRALETQETATLNQAFKASESGTLTLHITDDKGATIVTRENYTFKKGLYYSIFLIGTKDAKENDLYIGVIPH